MNLAVSGRRTLEPSLALADLRPFVDGRPSELDAPRGRGPEPSLHRPNPLRLRVHRHLQPDPQRRAVVAQRPIQPPLDGVHRMDLARGAANAEERR